MRSKKTIIGKEKIIKELKRIAKELDKTPTWTESVSFTNISMASLKKIFGTYNKALEAAGLQINMVRKPGARRSKATYSHKRKTQLHKPIFTLRTCNMCERPFKAEDNMRSCPACTTTKKGSDNSCCFSDTAHGIGYLH